MSVSKSLKPSELLDRIGSTTPGNKNIPLYVGHEDGPALNHDYGADIGGREINDLGNLLKPFVQGAMRGSVFQLNHGGAIAANVKIIVRNIFAYEQRLDEHYPPVTWVEFKKLFLAQNDYIEKVTRQHPDTYITIATREELEFAMKTDGEIGILKSVEGMPRNIDVPLDQAAQMFADAKIQVLDLMVNSNTDVGDSHTTNKDKGLSSKGKDFLTTCADAGIPVFDVSHASPRTAMDMIKLIGPNRRVIASHTGARIGNVAEYSRNITDDVARGIFERNGIIGIATAGRLLGGNTVEYVVSTIRHFVELDPTGGRLVTLGPDTNGIQIESKVEGVATVLELQNIAGALHKAGFSDDMIEDIFWRNAYDFWYSALEDVKKPA